MIPGFSDAQPLTLNAINLKRTIIIMKKTIGIWRSWALVAGMMIGSGIFTLPALLAAYGSYSFLGWVVTGFGALCLALTYSFLSTRNPGLGGPYFFVREAFGAK